MLNPADGQPAEGRPEGDFRLLRDRAANALNRSPAAC
jgi:hypothetical protein